MSKKTLLEEGTIRRMMKLANIGALSEGYFDQFNEEEEEEMGAEAPMDAAAEDPMAAAEEPMDAEPAAEGGAAAEVPEAAVKEIVDAIASAVSEVTGTPVAASGGAEEMPAEMPAEEPMDAAAGEEVGPEEEDPATRYEGKAYKREDDKDDKEEMKEDDGDEETKNESRRRLSEDEMVATIAKRVAARLIAANK